MHNIPKIRNFAPGDPLHVSAQQIWIILVALCQARRFEQIRVPPTKPPTITYGELAVMIGRSNLAGRTLSRQLMIVGLYCKENDLPCLNALVVDRFGECGEGVVTTNERHPKEERKAVARQDWFAVGIPSTGTLRKVYANWLEETRQAD